MTIVHSTVFLKHSGSERNSSGGLCWLFLNRFANYIILTRRSLYSLVINLHSLTRNCNPLCSRPLPTLLPNDVVVNGKLTPATWRITNQFSWKESLPAGLLLFCSNGDIFPSTKLHGTRLTFRPLTSVSGGLRRLRHVIRSLLMSLFAFLLSLTPFGNSQ